MLEERCHQLDWPFRRRRSDKILQWETKNWSTHRLGLNLVHVGQDEVDSDLGWNGGRNGRSGRHEIAWKVWQVIIGGNFLPIGLELVRDLCLCSRGFLLVCSLCVGACQGGPRSSPYPRARPQPLSRKHCSSRNNERSSLNLPVNKKSQSQGLCNCSKVYLPLVFLCALLQVRQVVETCIATMPR